MADNITTQSATPATLPASTLIAALLGALSGDTVYAGAGVLLSPSGAEGSWVFTPIRPATEDTLTAIIRMFNVAASAMTRPANQTPYTANDAVSNNATNSSVTAISFTVSDTNDAPISLERMRVASTDTGIGGKGVRAWLYRSDPTASSGIVGGDNAAFSTKQGTLIGTMSGVFKAFSDGAVAELTPESGVRILTLPTSGAKTVFALFQTLEDFTPSANSTTFTATLEGMQGRA